MTAIHKMPVIMDTTLHTTIVELAGKVDCAALTISPQADYLLDGNYVAMWY